LSITETVLVFVGIPALVVVAVYAAVYGTTARRGGKRYRPGRPFTFTPVWFLANTDNADNVGTKGPAGPALGVGKQRQALPGPLLAQSAEEPGTARGETGGASDTW
jgi:hypothetical protein